ncbi:integrase catalytic domain-containing protein [Trichonephila clavipes]|nr:integrase catalytic domain-containing protein [Trichonephila clavipes]
MSNLRESYWIIKSRKTIRQVVRSCIACKRFSARSLETVSIPLPEDRVRDAAIFEVCGVDLCGPLFLKENKKCWIVLFTCAIYRAVHLELITSLSTDSFILAFRRFIARRGRPTTIHSDNGKNFVGTFNALNSIDWDKIQDFALKIKIQWKFSPPSAPWWGGFWERIVGMLKNVLRKVLGKASLNEEELNTLLCDAESIINSRPITYLSEDPKDLVALTPAMFLQEIREIGVPDFDMIDSKKLERRFIYRVKIRKDLRNRFRNEYLGKDGRIRVVEVKTPSGNFIRPIQKLYPLEVNLPEASDFRERIQKDQKNQEISTSRRGRTLRPPKRLEL